MTASAAAVTVGSASAWSTWMDAIAARGMASATVTTPRSRSSRTVTAASGMSAAMTTRRRAGAGGLVGGEDAPGGRGRRIGIEQPEGPAGRLDGRGVLEFLGVVVEIPLP